jgi:LemA protein
MVRAKNSVEQAFADIDVVLKKRFDLIPNLVNTVKGYAKHEKETFTEVVEARNLAQNAKTTNEKVVAENKLNGALKNIWALEERYPDLKANKNFLSLQESLTKMESEIAAQRKQYNSIVTNFNSSIQVFPSNILASIFKFSKFELFKIVDAKERENVKVEF